MNRQGKDFSGRVTPLFPTMMVQTQEEVGEGLTNPTDPYHTPTIIQPSTSQPKKKHPRKSKKKNIEVPQPSDSNDDVADENEPTHSNDPLLSVSSEDEGLGDQEDASKQERKINEIDQDAKDMVEKEVDMAENDVRIADPVTTAGEVVTTTNAEVTTDSATTITVGELTLAQTLIEVKVAKPKVRGVMIQEPSEFTTTTTTTTIAASKPSEDKGKAKMIKPEKPLKKKDYIIKEDANIVEWDDVQAMMDADYELAARLHADEQGELTLEKSQDYKNVEAEIDDDQEEAEMKKCMEIVPDDEMLQNIDKEDLETLWKLVKAKHGVEESTRTQSDSLESIFFKWSTFCEISKSAYLYAGRKEISTYTSTIIEMLNKKLQANHWNEMCYQLLKLITKQLKNPGSV
ncbi:hypothetical protein Tco_1401645 [Tanacetum coccineum]